MNEATTPVHLLEFWFGEARSRPEAISDRMAFWFRPSTADDEAVQAHFERTMQQAAGGVLTHWPATPAGRLALILALDQAPRVIYRRRPEAFAHDGQALALTLAGIVAGIDHQYGLAERAFFYMPLQHAEDSLVQEQSVRMYEGLVADFLEHADIAKGFLQHAREHADIIERFGRYPHRNEALGRESTEEELAFLESGPRYGQ
ncbi:DUF924 family protein [Wenzhouxiangella sp. EGI_FJ10305]|uniref:DUF924 family protein n=1 Tax=Wenzhouxiangella sp. EGI_FJ10305 TaxID=3243768 RepID=UPI0035D94225